MAALSTLIFVTVFVILIVKLALNYLKTVNFIKSFPNPGIPLPFFGHNLMLLNKDPSEVYPILKDICYGSDPEMRKVAGCIGISKKLFIFHPEVAETVLSSNVHITKSADYEALLEWLGTGLLISSVAAWSGKR